MGKLVVEGSVRAKLADTSECVELCDTAGNTIGYFTPARIPKDLQPQISEEEIARRQADPERYTFQQVMDHLRSL
jgi:hypothetical protein